MYSHLGLPSSHLFAVKFNTCPIPSHTLALTLNLSHDVTPTRCVVWHSIYGVCRNELSTKITGEDRRELMELQYQVRLSVTLCLCVCIYICVFVCLCQCAFVRALCVSYIRLCVWEFTDVYTISYTYRHIHYTEYGHEYERKY